MSSDNVCRAAPDFGLVQGFIYCYSSCNYVKDSMVEI